jgi:hypothetical protein
VAIKEINKIYLEAEKRLLEELAKQLPIIKLDILQFVDDQM